MGGFKGFGGFRIWGFRGFKRFGGFRIWGLRFRGLGFRECFGPVAATAFVERERLDVLWHCVCELITVGTHSLPSREPSSAPFTS